MATLTELNTWRDRLQDARFSGVREVQDSNGEKVTYRSDSELSRALAALDSEISAASNRPANTIQFQTSKGV